MSKLISWQEFEAMDEAARQAALAEMGKMVAQTAVFQHTTDMLSYHNQLVSLIQLLQNGYTQLQTSDNPSEWQQQTIAALLMDTLIFQFLESDSPERENAPSELVNALQSIVPIDADELNRYLAHLRGYTQYQWQLAHLTEHPPQNMAVLMIEFLAFAYKEEKVAYGRTNLIRHLLPTYFVERRTGQLNPRQNISDLMRQGRPIPKPPAGFHPLAPDKESLQRFLAKLLNYDPVRPYAAAALFTLLPIWLRFLQVRNLLTDAEADAALDDLAWLKGDLHSYFANLAGDDALATAVANWPGK
ncbi:hypothetical protein [Candidatus Leptofilum sp.]|uniref:hypothetical protein n=1 Tax=Candidatus Leptofilum sp. TaxID=3241576 RepID=UPI003B59F3FA